MKKIKIFQVDAFAEELFTGNPAAVCLLDNWLPDDIMQKIAMENNLAETAFIKPHGENWSIRWFTPKVEVDLCGHATLASALVVFLLLEPKKQKVEFYSEQSGWLPVVRNEDLLSLNFPVDEITIYPKKEQIEKLLQISITDVQKGKSDLLVVVDSEKVVQDYQPDFEKMKKIEARGIILSAKGKDYDFVSRFFAPKIGINEDPVTGSAHTTLVPYWSKILNKTFLRAKQLSERSGKLYCKILNNSRVEISGKAQLYLLGEIYID